MMEIRILCRVCLTIWRTLLRARFNLSTPVENSPFRRSKSPHPMNSQPVPAAAFPLCPLSLILGSAARTARSGQGHAGFAPSGGPFTARTVLRHLWGGKGGLVSSSARGNRPACANPSNGNSRRGCWSSSNGAAVGRESPSRWPDVRRSSPSRRNFYWKSGWCYRARNGRSPVGRRWSRPARPAAGTPFHRWSKPSTPGRLACAGPVFPLDRLDRGRPPDHARFSSGWWCTRARPISACWCASYSERARRALAGARRVIISPAKAPTDLLSIPAMLIRKFGASIAWAKTTQMILVAAWKRPASPRAASAPGRGC